ncbi:MAG: hypothetical protein ACXVBB_15205, partial [Isosphaeraceae bacterium]
DLEVDAVNGDNWTVGDAQPGDPERSCQDVGIRMRRCQYISSNGPREGNAKEQCISESDGESTILLSADQTST